MKRILFCLLLSLTVVFANAQPFEGKIIYRISYNMPNAGADFAKQLTVMMGDTLEYFIKRGSYKNVLNGSLLNYQLFVASENKLYTKLSKTDALHWNDAAMITEPVLDTKMLTKQGKILGRKCDALVVNTKTGTTCTYYFNKKYKLEPADYKNHQFGNWSVLARTYRCYTVKGCFLQPAVHNDHRSR